MRRTRRYVVHEMVTAWSEYIVEAHSKAEAVAIVKRGEAAINDPDSTSDSSGPNGRYFVWRLEGAQHDA